MKVDQLGPQQRAHRVAADVLARVLEIVMQFGRRRISRADDVGRRVAKQRGKVRVLRADKWGGDQEDM